MEVYRTRRMAKSILPSSRAMLRRAGSGPVRMHSVNIWSDVSASAAIAGAAFAGRPALHALAAEARGVMVLIRDTGPRALSCRPAADGKSAGRTRQPADGLRRRRTDPAPIWACSELILLTNSPLPKIVGLEGYGPDDRRRAAAIRLAPVADLRAPHPHRRSAASTRTSPTSSPPARSPRWTRRAPRMSASPCPALWKSRRCSASSPARGWRRSARSAGGSTAPSLWLCHSRRDLAL